jgi:hypothetical protein
MSGFWVPGAVHVACALVSNLPIDEEYLRATFQLERLPEWRDKAAALAAA